VVALNRAEVRNIDHIEVGQVLKLPKGAGPEPQGTHDRATISTFRY
jgi:hypothetical protein